MTTRWLQSNGGKVLYGLVLGLLLIVLLGVFPNNAAAACTGSGCNGKDPMAQGCNSDATTQKAKSLTLGETQLRYSSTCDAMWARTKNTEGFWYYAAATVWWAYPGSVSYSYSGGAYPNQAVYTNMLADTNPGQACGKVQSTSISVPIARNSSSYCTGWY